MYEILEYLTKTFIGCNREAENMDTYYGYIAVAAACLAVLFILFAKKKAEFLLNFCVRGVVGLTAIYFLNRYAGRLDPQLFVGMNPVTAVTVSTLGFSGVALLYGIIFYKNL